MILKTKLQEKYNNLSEAIADQAVVKILRSEEKKNACFDAYLSDQGSVLLDGFANQDLQINLYHIRAEMNIFTAMLLSDSVIVSRIATSNCIHYAEDSDLCFDHTSILHQSAWCSDHRSWHET